MIAQGRRLYTDDALGVDLDQTVYALDSTTIDLCLSLFPWARVGRERNSIKVHTLLDLHGNIPARLALPTTDCSTCSCRSPARSTSWTEATWIRATRLLEPVLSRLRRRSNLKFRRLYSHPVDRSTGLICDQTIVLTGRRPAVEYPDELRRIRFRDAEKDEAWTYLTNDFELPALTVAELYRSRWQVELFFRWIKQHLRIKAFYGTSPNAVRSQIWIGYSRQRAEGA